MNDLQEFRAKLRKIKLTANLITLLILFLCGLAIWVRYEMTMGG